MKFELSKQVIRNVNWKIMKITNSVHKKMRLLNEKMIKERLMKKAYNYMVCLRKQQITYESN